MANHLRDLLEHQPYEASDFLELQPHETSEGATTDYFPDLTRTINTLEPGFTERLEMHSNLPEFGPNEPNPSIAQLQPLAFDDAVWAYVSRHQCLDKKRIR